jgi:hypothetical protein
VTRNAECLWHDGWVSPSDLREGVKVWGSHTPNHNPEYWTGRPLLAEDDRALLWLDCSMVGAGPMRFWLIDINPDCSWHYHKEA